MAPRRDLAWDAGCGSGQLSLRLVERFERVIATDVSMAQLAQATPHPKIEYRRAPAESSSLTRGAVDLAVAAQAVHWFDLDAYYAEVRRVTRAGSVIALVTYGMITVDEKIDAVIRRFYSGVLGPHWPPERRHVEDGYRSLAFPFEEIEAPKLEICTAWGPADLLGYVDTWSAVHSLEEAQGRWPIEAFHEQLLSAWGSEIEPRPVRWPLSLRLGVL